LADLDIFRGDFPANEPMIKIFFVPMLAGGLLALIIGKSQDLYSQTLLISNSESTWLTVLPQLWRITIK
jgi:hypothetical protein